VEEEEKGETALVADFEEVEDENEDEEVEEKVEEKVEGKIASVVYKPKSSSGEFREHVNQLAYSRGEGGGNNK